MKKLIDKLFLWLGYFPLVDAAEVIVNQYNFNYKKPEVTPERAHAGYDVESWSDYWGEQYEPHYIAWYFRSIGRYPKIAQNLVRAMSFWDWERTRSFMESVGWTWGDKEFTPSIYDLMETVIDLTNSCVISDHFDGKNYDGISTGGFTVIIKDENVIIHFNKKFSMYMINIVNKRTHKPTDRDVYIGRPTPVGNPFTHLKDTTAPYKVDTRDQAIELYKPWFKKQLLSNSTSSFSYMMQKIISMAASGDVNLVCWCYPNRCHGEVIKEYVEEVLKETQ